MLFELLSFLCFLLMILGGYVLPVMLASKALLADDKRNLNRWLFHFIVLGVLQFTLFPINNWLGSGSTQISYPQLFSTASFAIWCLPCLR